MLGECAKRLLAWSPITLRDTKLSIVRLIIVKNKKNFDPFFPYKMDWIKPKTISHYCAFKDTGHIFKLRDFASFSEQIDACIFFLYERFFRLKGQ
jgi:hypothetical protein